MKVIEISHTSRFNTGNYEHAEYTLKATLDEADAKEAAKGLSSLKKIAADAHGETAADVDTKKSTVDETKEPVEKKAPKKTAKPAKPVEEEEEVEEETEEAPEEETVDEEEEKPAKKAFKKKGSPYDRTNENHKSLLADLLAQNFPKWKTTEASKNKAKAASKSLDGEDFLDAEGEVLPAFVKSFKAAMK